MNRIVEVSSTEVNFYIFGIIGLSNYYSDDTNNTAATFTSDFLYCEKKYNKINVIINSLGGYVHEGNAIANLIKQSKKEVHTFNLGIAASMGAVILMSGHKIFVAKNSTTLLHSPSSVAIGTIRDMQQEIEHLEAVTEGLIEVLASKSEKTKDEIRAAYFDYNDHSLTASAMVDLNFAEYSDAETVFPKNITQNQVNNLDKNYNQVVNAYMQYDNMNIQDILHINSHNNNQQNHSEMNREEIALSLGLAKDASEDEIKAKIADNKAKADAADAKEAQEAAEKAAEEEKAGKTADQIAKDTEHKKLVDEISAKVLDGLKKPATGVAGVKDDGTPPKDIETTPLTPEAKCEKFYTEYKY